MALKMVKMCELCFAHLPSLKTLVDPFAIQENSGSRLVGDQLKGGGCNEVYVAGGMKWSGWWCQQPAHKSVATLSKLNAQPSWANRTHKSVTSCHYLRLHPNSPQQFIASKSLSEIFLIKLIVANIMIQKGRPLTILTRKILAKIKMTGSNKSKSRRISSFHSYQSI